MKKDYENHTNIFKKRWDINSDNFRKMNKVVLIKQHRNTAI